MKGNVIGVLIIVLAAAISAEAQDWVIEHESLAALPFENFSIPAEEVHSGSIYFFGGYHGSFPVVANDGIRRYDVAGNFFEDLSFTLSLEMGQNAVTSPHVGDVFYLPPAFSTGDWGGWGSHNRFVEVDLVGQTSRELYPLPNVSRIWGVGSTAANGKIYFFGGWIGSNRAEISEYDPATDTFRHVTNMLQARAPVHAVQAQDGWIYYWATGRYWALGIERFNPLTGAVETVTTDVTAWFEPYVFWYLPDENAIFLVEGFLGQWLPRRVLRFDLESRTFSDIGATVGPYLANHRATRDPNDPKTIYVQWIDDGILPIRLVRLTLRPANEPPVADAGADQWHEVGPDCTAEVPLDGSGSFDLDGDPLTFEWSHPAFGIATGETATIKLPIGVFVIQLTIDDGRGGVTIDEVTVTVVDATPPDLYIAADSVLAECAGPTGTSVTLPNASAVDACDGPVSVTDDRPSAYPLGATVVTFTAADVAGNSASYQLEVTVEDSTGPAVTRLEASPNILWPPNHTMRGLELAVTATDVCDPISPACVISNLASTEPETGCGSGDTKPDWVITGELAVDLRAERCGNDDDRLYTITISCTDEAGNLSTESLVVTVPHDQGG